MTRRLLINAGVGDVRIALIEGGRLVRFSVEPLADTDGAAGDIILGRVEKLAPAMEAAFVAIGGGRSGFLGARDMNGRVSEGEAVLVRIVRQAIGDKAARLSALLSLAGRFCVLQPGGKGVAVSRRIADAAERARLAGLCAPPDGMGLLVRTNAGGVSGEELAADISALLTTWREIEARRAGAKPPATLYREPGPVVSAMRDWASADIAEILIDDAGALSEARDYCRRAMPPFESRLKLFAGTGGVLDDWEEEIARLQDRRITLACGGWITIEATEGFTAIDVNSGSFRRSGGRAETALAVNLEAAMEIARQISLRGIGGLIVADFIQMESEQAHARLMSVLETELAKDAEPVELSALPRLGLVAIARKRSGESLAQKQSVVCSCCSGAGRMPAEGTVAQAALRRAESEARANPGRAIAIRAAADVAAWLETHRDHFMPRLERRGVSRISFEAEPKFAREVFDVRSL